VSYTKPWTSTADQLTTLKARGLQVSDDTKALEYLGRIGYYRLSGYWFAFRQLSDAPCSRWDSAVSKKNKPKPGLLALETFKPGATFQNSVDLYVFDKQLRMLAMGALERVEIALRVDISHTLGKLDRFAYLKPALFHSTFSEVIDTHSGVSSHHAWVGKHAQLISRSKEEFVAHNRAAHGLPLAIWVACEVWDFGTMSTLFKGMREAEQDTIAAKYGVANGRVFATWLRSLNYLRNVCAHHSRLWNRNIVDQPKLPSTSVMPWVAPFESNDHAKARCFLLICMLRHLLGVINPSSHWPDRMKAHLLSFPDLNHLGLNLWGMGTPADWETNW
jgi:abortive infection bacteriophage resistance protein